nr:MAG TPA: hypothetical protein [Caudoviricetes sp.]
MVNLIYHRIPVNARFSGNRCRRERRKQCL